MCFVCWWFNFGFKPFEFYINNCNRLNRTEIWFYWLIILVLISHDWFRDGFKPIESEFGFIGSLSLLCHQLSAMWWQFVRGVKVALDMLLMHGHALQQENEPLKEYQDNLFSILTQILYGGIGWKVGKLKRIVGIWTVGQMSPPLMELLDLITIRVFIMAGNDDTPDD